ncbi:tubulin alpha-2 chain-like [Daktulosphaira vitifoliae]|uniref:tubulin alpha-2 chain-like n=1 Tax=Daktulosphaira vitifoliae TaxID=58002 RepID=UPI0021A9B3DC|nr:tubulin alpha-2 chain-like [Daktulosphaira vitifoliae]
MSKEVESTVLSTPPPPFPLTQGEFIFIHVGQAGIQIGSACWELFCLEHGINPDGTVQKLTTSSTSIFSLSQMGKYVPRALLVDTEPSVIDEIRTGAYKDLFPSQNIFTGKENAASNFASGLYGIGKRLSKSILDQLKTLAEDCNSLQGIAIFRSIGGGTGSGLGTLLIESIKDLYLNKTVLDFNVYPSPQLSSVIVEPYNAILTTHHVLDLVNCSMIFDNSALYNICFKLGIIKPTYTNINRIISQVSSGITSSLRFEGSLTSNLSELLSNLIQWPRLHFPLITHAPIMTNINNLSANSQLARMCFDVNNQMIIADPQQGKYLSICMMFRGDLTPTDVNTTIAFIQREHTIPVTNMNSPPFKFGLCYRPPITVPNSDIVPTAKTITTLCNNTAVRYRWESLLKKYDTLTKKRAFMHHYVGEGMEEGIFTSAKQNIIKLIADYEEVEK